MSRPLISTLHEPGRKTGMAAAVALLVLHVMSGCSGIESGSQWAPQAAARSTLGQSFIWATEVDPRLNDLQELDAPLRDLLRTTVEKELEAKGYAKGSSPQGDFWLRCRLTSATRGDAYSADLEQYTEGALVIYMLDPQTGTWMWRGWATARLKEANSPEQKRQRLAQAVQMMFKEVPVSRGTHAD